ncbi:hypothetical protein IWW35_001395 [Coemansia sp. RSA 1878]|nr:hypothetical protein IWW35_001395 [Coemansia sp. RSA 1878]
MADLNYSQVSAFAQHVYGHPRFDGKPETLSVNSLEQILQSTFRLLKVEDTVRQAILAESLLNHTVLDSWGAYCEAEGIVETATLTQLLQYLRATYDTISTSYQALTELMSLTFSVDTDLPQFNQQFDYLVNKAELSANQPSLALNHYRHAMPTHIKRELFTADIVNVCQAQTRALDLWCTRQPLKAESNQVMYTSGKPMDIDRVAVKAHTRRGPNNHSRPNTRQGLQFNAEQFPCTEAEFQQRLNAGACVYCGRNNHVYRHCQFRGQRKRTV